MLDIPRTNNEKPLPVPLNNAAVTALRVVYDRAKEAAVALLKSSDLTSDTAKPTVRAVSRKLL